jgi:NAD(P)-dependent dehydrogenase (short-subunit alcohol dehydrogenase family)
MNLGLESKTAVVTGASRGIGKAIAISLANEGVNVIAVARNTEALDLLRQEMPGEKNKHLFVPIDLQESNGPEKLIQFTRNKKTNVDILVNNLGGSLQVTEPFASSDDWNKVWHFNLGISQTLNCAYIPEMIKQRWGRIVHVSTLSTQTNTGNSAYMSAKCAVDGYVKNVSKSISRYNVLMNAVAPGLVHLENRYSDKLLNGPADELDDYYDNHLPIRRMAKVEEIASVATFLCSEQASYMAGSIVRVDGGGH